MFKLLKKSQIWYIDLSVALSIFLIMLVFSFKFLSETYIFEKDNNMISEADRLSAKLMTPGIPENWTNEDVISIGLTRENKLDTSKINYLINLSKESYPNVKAILSIKSDFIIFFENRTGDMINFSDSGYIGMPGKTQYNIEAEEKVFIERYLAYTYNNISEILSMKVVLWD